MRPCFCAHNIILIILRDRERVSVSIAHLLGYLLADPVWTLLVFMFTLLFGLLGALLSGMVGTLLFRDLTTFLTGYNLTLLLLHLPAHLTGHLHLPLLGNILALVMGLDLAGAGDDDPLHVVALALPRVLAVLAVCSGALGLIDSHVLCSVLLLTHLLPHSSASLLMNLLTLFSGCRLAPSL